VLSTKIQGYAQAEIDYDIDKEIFKFNNTGNDTPIVAKKCSDSHAAFIENKGSPMTCKHKSNGTVTNCDIYVSETTLIKTYTCKYCKEGFTYDSTSKKCVVLGCETMYSGSDSICAKCSGQSAAKKTKCVGNLKLAGCSVL